MISWIVIIAVIVLGFLIMKMFHLRHKLMLFTVILLVLFIGLSIMFVAKQHNLDLKSTQGAIDSIKVYLSWLGNGFSNFKTLTGNAVAMDWKKAEPPKNTSSAK